MWSVSTRRRLKSEVPDHDLGLNLPTSKRSGAVPRQLFFTNEELLAMQDAIGLVETKGLVALVEATDAMAKAANVEIVKRVASAAAW